MAKKTNKTLKGFEKLVQGMVVEQINFTYKEDNVEKMLEDYFADDLTKESTSGKGIIFYEGKTNESKSIFSGYSPALDSYCLKFFGEEGMKAFQNFQNHFLSKSEFAKQAASLKVSSVVVSYSCSVPDSLKTPQDYNEALAKVITSQTKISPKIVIQGSCLVIGSKTGNNCLQIEALTSNPGTLAGLILSYKLKDKTSNNVLEILIKAPDMSLETAVAYQMLELMNKVSFTSLLEYINADVMRRYQVGKVSMQVAASKNKSSRSGEYVLRSLTGIFNKLKDPTSSEEIKKIILDWLPRVAAQQNLVPKGTEFVKAAANALVSAKPLSAAEAAKPLRKKRASRTTVQTAQTDTSILEQETSAQSEKTSPKVGDIS